MKIVIWLLSLTFFVTGSMALAIPVDSCDFYDQLEVKMKCGEGGYIQKFASPYCKAYLSRNNEFSSKGQIILRNIRLCLQEILALKANSLTCAELEDYGIASHEYCYLNAGYCELGGADRLRVFWVARGEVLNIPIWSLVAKVQTQCLQDP